MQYSLAIPSSPVADSCDPTADDRPNRGEVEALRNILRSDEPFPDEPPALDHTLDDEAYWERMSHDFEPRDEAELRDAYWHVTPDERDLSDDANDACAGWTGGAQW